MGQYIPPLRDIQFVMHELLDTESEFKQMPAYADMDIDTMNAIVEEAGKFASSVVFPLNQSGDLEGCTLNGNEVTTPKGFKQAYKQFVDAGWPSLSCDPQYGGQGLPFTLNHALYETLDSASVAWTMYPGLSHGAYECLHAHGTEEIKALYLPKLTTGEWTGSMCLTEPHCGTDLGLLRSKATPNADGSYSITGTKIFISSGEHDLAENIIHLVLARLPDSEKGTKGISLFIVPKFIPNADGTIGARNPVTCARLGVGMLGLGLTEISYQNARNYAKERVQMRSLSGVKNPEKEADFIIVHPDVRRMLLTQRAYSEGARAFTYWLALEIDKELSHPNEAVRKAAADNVALLTPITKAFLTDNAFECANHGVQVFGGHGFIIDNGMEQYVRDARITQLYEGTNGVQALDLLGRKVLGDMGAKLRAFGEIVKAFVEENGVNMAMQEFVAPLGDIGEKVSKLTMEIGMKAMQNQDEVGAASVPYQRVVGHMVFSYFWARMAKVALEKQDQDDFYKAKLATARFYFAKLLPETAGYIRQARAGVASLNEMQDDWF